MSESRVDEMRDSFTRAIRAVWWLTLLRGVLLIILGLYALINPGMALVTLAQVAGFYMILEGFLAVWAGLSGQTDSRTWTTIRGILLVIVGLIALAHPVIFGAVWATFLVCLAAIGFIASGIAEIYFAIRERKQIEGEGWLIVGGILAVILGVLLISAPMIGALVIVRVLGFYAIIAGIVLIVAAFRFRDFGKKLKG